MDVRESIIKMLYMIEDETKLEFIFKIVRAFLK